MNQRRIIYIVLAVVGITIAILVLLYLRDRAQTGELVVTTNRDSAQISASALDQPAKVIGRGTARTRLAPGTYAVIASDGEAQSEVPAEVHQGQTTTVNLDIQDLKAVTKVAINAARDILATDKTLYFVNPADRLMYYYDIGAPRAWRYLPEIFPVNRALWLDSTRALLGDTDGYYKYLLGTKAEVVEMTSPKPRDVVPPPDSVSMNTHGQVAYVADGQVFIKEKPAAAAAPRLLAKLSGLNPEVVLSNNGLVLHIEGVEAGEGIAGETGPGARNNEILSIATGRKSGAQPPTGDEILGAAWSPDSSKLAYSSSRGLYVLDRTSSETRQVFSGRPTHASSITWTSATSFVYAYGSNIWRFSTNGATTIKLANITGSVSPFSPFAVSPNKQTLYYGADPGTNGPGGIYRLGL